MVTTERNRSCVPYLESEGVFVKPLTKIVEPDRGPSWYTGLSAYDRLYNWHTLSSARYARVFKPTVGLIPRDDLDFILQSHYNHTTEIFPDTIDVYLQNETMGINTWRRLRNEKDIVPDLHSVVSTEGSGTEKVAGVYGYNDYHPVLIGGLIEKKHPSNVKLMNSSHHSPQTNAGYTRQPTDGNVFQY